MAKTIDATEHNKKQHSFAPFGDNSGCGVTKGHEAVKMIHEVTEVSALLDTDLTKRETSSQMVADWKVTRCSEIMIIVIIDESLITH